MVSVRPGIIGVGLLPIFPLFASSIFVLLVFYALGAVPLPFRATAQMLPCKCDYANWYIPDWLSWFTGETLV